MDSNSRYSYVDEPEGVSIGCCWACANDQLREIPGAEPCESCIALWVKNGNEEAYAWRLKDEEKTASGRQIEGSDKR